jgi:hypothetical protein
MWTGLIGSPHGKVTGFFEVGNKHLGSTKCGEGVNNIKLIYLRCFYIDMEHL